MGRVLLSNTDDWKLADNEADIRGWKVTDASGKRIGTVRDLAVDTDRECVDTLLLDDGRQVAAREVDIRDGEVHLMGGAATAARPHAETGAGPDRLRLVEERLRVHKQPVERGEVRLRKESIPERKTVEVPVTREELVVERHPVSGEQPARGSDLGNREIRVPLREEEVRVEKQPVVKEEVTAGKRPVQDTREVTDTVRREELRVDKEGDIEKSDVERKRKAG